MKYKLFSTKNCPKCLLVRNALLGMESSFEVVDMSTPESQTELYSNGVFTLSAPVLQVGDKFYTIKDLFDGEKLREVPSC